jgi:hypothetical protein
MHNGQASQYSKEATALIALLLQQVEYISKTASIPAAMKRHSAQQENMTSSQIMQIGSTSVRN